MMLGSRPPHQEAPHVMRMDGWLLACRFFVLQVVLISNRLCSSLVMASRPDSCANASRQHSLNYDFHLQGSTDPSLGYEAFEVYGHDAANDIKNFSNEAKLLDGNSVEAQTSSENYAVKLQEAGNTLKDLREGAKAFVGIMRREHTQHVQDIKDRLRGGSEKQQTSHSGENQQRSDSSVSTKTCSPSSSNSRRIGSRIIFDCEECIDKNMLLQCNGTNLAINTAFYQSGGKCNITRDVDKSATCLPKFSDHFNETCKEKGSPQSCLFSVHDHAEECKVKGYTKMRVTYTCR